MVVALLLLWELPECRSVASGRRILRLPALGDLLVEAVAMQRAHAAVEAVE